MSSHATRSLHPAPLLAGLLSILLAACGGAPADQLANSRPTTAPGGVTSAAIAPTSISPPTAVPTAPAREPEALLDPSVRATGFAQADQQLGFGVTIENPNAGAALQDVILQLVAYGADDLVLGTDENTIPLLPPNSTIHYGGDMYLDAESPVERLEAQLIDRGEGKEASAQELPTFPVEAVAFTESDYGQSVSGVVKNPFARSLTDLYVGIVGYNGADEVVGGGFTYLSFLDPEGAGAFSTSVTMREAPARVEISPLVSALTLFGERDPAARPTITLEEQGWAADSSAGLGYGVVVRNPDPAQAMEDAQYRATVYGKGGEVLAVDTGYFATILPGAKGAHGGTIYLNDGAVADRIEVQVFPGSLADAADLRAFAAEGVSYVPGSFGANVTGRVANPYDEQVENAEVVAILRDGAGKIVGGGSAYIDTLPGAGQVAVEVSVSGARAASAELYAGAGSITTVGAD